MYNIARGIDLEPVTTRIISKSISCCKRFPFKHVLTALGSVEHWLNELAIEVTDRLEQELAENNRRAKQITVSFAQEIEKKTINGSKTFPLSCYKQEKIFRDAFEIAKKHLVIKADGSLIVNFLGLTAGNFRENKQTSIVDLFKNVKTSKTAQNEDKLPERQQNIIENGQEDGEAVKIKAFTSKGPLRENEVEQNASTFNDFSANNNGAENVEEQTSFLSENNDSLFANLAIKFSYDDCSYSSDECNISIDEGEVIQDVENKRQDLLVSMQNRSETYEEDTSTTTEDAQKDGNTQNNDETCSRVGCNNVNLDRSLGVEEQNTSSSCLKDQYAKSFFLNYFANLEKINRENRIREKEYQELTDNIFKNSASKKDSRDLSRSPVSELHLVLPNEIEVCFECQKNIPRVEMVSHMDYHFAMRLVNEDEKTMNKNTRVKDNTNKEFVNPSSNKSKKSIIKGSSSSAVSSSSKSKNGKKKSSLETKSITSFLEKIDELNDSNSDVCGECRKRVRFEDFDNHSDYHAAKRLHTELNSNTKSSNSVLDKNIAKRSVKTSPNISNFFKKA